MASLTLFRRAWAKIPQNSGFENLCYCSQSNLVISLAQPITVCTDWTTTNPPLWSREHQITTAVGFLQYFSDSSRHTSRCVWHFAIYSYQFCGHISSCTVYIKEVAHDLLAKEAGTGSLMPCVFCYEEHTSAESFEDYTCPNSELSSKIMNLVAKYDY
jgi:hypothetical protein